MPPQSSTAGQNNPKQGSDTGPIILIIILLLVVALGAGYYFYTMNRPVSTPLPYQQEPQTSYPVPETTTAPQTSTEAIPTPSPEPSPTNTNSYVGWKTYIYRAPGGGGFTIKYPPGFAVGQERTKDEAYFTVYPSPNPLNKPEVMQIYYEGNGDVRFAQNDNGDEWPFYDQVVQSFEKLK